MERMKRGIVIALLFAALAAVAAAPVLVTSCTNRRLLGKVTVKKLAAEQEQSQNSVLTESVEERIKIIKNSLVVKTFGYKKYQGGSAGRENVSSADYVLKAMEEQLDFMEDMGISFEEGTAGAISRRTYMDAENPGREVSILDINAEYSSFFVEAYMDTETHLIYEIFLYPKSDEYLYGLRKLGDGAMTEAFSNYLGLEYDHKNEDGEGFFVNISNYEWYLHLFVCSYNENTSEFVQYSIEESEVIGVNSAEKAVYEYPKKMYRIIDVSDIRVFDEPLQR